MDTNYSLSDIAAINNGNGFGGNSAWILILLFAMIFNGGGFFGGRSGDYGQFATAASQQEILFGQRFSNLDNKMDRLGNGLADATYALNNTVVSEGRATQGAIGQNRFDMSNYAHDMKEAIRAEGEATRALMQQNKIETLREQVNQLTLQQQLCGVVRYPNSMSYAISSNPFCNCGNGCGCGNI